jgi:hypothetical protein
VVGGERHDQSVHGDGRRKEQTGVGEVEGLVGPDGTVHERRVRFARRQGGYGVCGTSRPDHHPDRRVEGLRVTDGSGREPGSGQGGGSDP